MMETGKENVPVGMRQAVSQAHLSLETIPPKKRAMYKRKLLHGLDNLVADVQVKPCQTNNSNNPNNVHKKYHKYLKVVKNMDDISLKTTDTLVIQSLGSTCIDVTTKEPSPIRNQDPLDHQTPERNPLHGLRNLKRDISKPLFPSWDDTKNSTCMEIEQSENQPSERVSNVARSETYKGVDDDNYRVGLEPVKQDDQPNFQSNPFSSNPVSLVEQSETQPLNYNVLTTNGPKLDNSDNNSDKSMRIQCISDKDTQVSESEQTDKGGLEYGDNRQSFNNSINEVVDKKAETDTNNEAENVDHNRSLEVIKNIEKTVRQRILPAAGHHEENSGVARFENSSDSMSDRNSVKENQATFNSSGELFDREQGVKNLRCESRKKLCWICGMDFATTEKLVQHMNFVHEGQQPYRCQHCFREFGQYNNLRRHLRVHREKEYKCKLCDRKFNEEFYLKMHMSTHTGERVYTCGVCNANFPSSQELKSHVSTHSPSKLHTCDVCGKSFSKACVLRQHRKGHSGERPHKCELCLKTFIHRHHLTMHLRSHKEQELYTCDICKKQFAQSSHLYKHMKSHEDSNLSEKVHEVSEPRRPNVTLNGAGGRSRVKSARNQTNQGRQNNEEIEIYELSGNGSWLINRPQKDTGDEINCMSKLHFSGGRIDEMKAEEYNIGRPENKMYEGKDYSKTRTLLSTTLSPSFRESLEFASIPGSNVPQYSRSCESSHQARVSRNLQDMSHEGSMSQEPGVSYSTKVTHVPNSVMPNYPSRVSHVPAVSHGSVMSFPEVSSGLRAPIHPSKESYGSSGSDGSAMSNHPLRSSHDTVMSHPSMSYGSQAAIMSHQTMPSYFYPYHYPNMNPVVPPFGTIYPSSDYYRAFLQQCHSSYMLDYMAKNPAVLSFGFQGHAVNNPGYIVAKEQEYQALANKEKGQRDVTNNKGQSDLRSHKAKEQEHESKLERQRDIYNSEDKEQEIQDHRSKTEGQRTVYSHVDKEKDHRSRRDTYMYTKNQIEECQRTESNYEAKEQAYQEQGAGIDIGQRTDKGFDIGLSSDDKLTHKELEDILKNSSSENTIESGDVESDDFMMDRNISEKSVADEKETGIPKTIMNEKEASEMKDEKRESDNVDCEGIESVTKQDKVVNEPGDGLVMKSAENIVDGGFRQLDTENVVQSKAKSDVTVDDIAERVDRNQTKAEGRESDDSENTVIQEMSKQRGCDETDMVGKGIEGLEGEIKGQQNKGPEKIVNVCYLVVGKNRNADVESEALGKSLDNGESIGDVKSEKEAKHEMGYESKSETVERVDNSSMGKDGGLLDRDSLDQIYRHAIDRSVTVDLKDKENLPEVYDQEHSRHRAAISNYWTLRPVLGNIQTESNTYWSNQESLNRAENLTKIDATNSRSVLSNTQGNRFTNWSEDVTKEDMTNSVTHVQYGSSGQHGMGLDMSEGVLDLSSKIPRRKNEDDVHE